MPCSQGQGVSSADYSVMAADLVPSAVLRNGKFGIRLRGGRTLGHFQYSCHYDSPTSQCSAYSVGWPYSPAGFRNGA